MVTEFDWLKRDMAPTTNQRQSALAFDVRGAPASKDESFAAASIFGQITGKRATLILGDDLEIPNTSETETKRVQLRTRMGELAGAILKPGGDMLLLGTAQHEQTVYKEYADEKGYELRIYPILHPHRDEDPKKDELLKYGNRLAPMVAEALQANPHLAGTSTEPTRFSLADIDQRKLEWGKTEFERQFMMWMDAGLSSQHPLKIRDLVVMDIAPPALPGDKVKLPATLQWAPLAANRLEDIHVDSLQGDSTVYAPHLVDDWREANRVICEVDPSGEGSDETSWSILAEMGGRVFLLWRGSSLEGHTDSVLESIANDCKTWGVKEVFVESNFGQGMFSTLLAPKLKEKEVTAEVTDERAPQVMKEKRIVENLETLTSTHRLVVNAEVLRRDFRDVNEYKDVEEAKRRFYRLTYQFTRMAKQRDAVKFNDRVDSLSSGAKRFVDALAQTLKDAQSKEREQALEEELERIKEARRRMGQPILGEEAPSEHPMDRSREGRPLR